LAGQNNQDTILLILASFGFVNDFFISNFRHLKYEKMDGNDRINFSRIEKAIEYIITNFKSQPGLDEIAENIHLSPYHFQRLFTDWAGVSPKKFLQYISVEYAKSILKDKHSTLFDAAFETGLSGTGRLHDLFINIEGMTPGEYKNGGENLSINYSFAESPFGDILVASTSKGICYMAFIANKPEGFASLQKNFPNAEYKLTLDPIQQNALDRKSVV
jgi:AraC family transcriptional regulator of adaptative response/methylated-DNA-[protein]-cysteine methyltransferase